MAELRLRDREIESVFQLLGERENDISYSVAWVLARCPIFLRAFLDRVGISTSSTEDVLIRLQQYAEDKGFTDIEIESRDQFHIIVEAKRGWNLPSGEQLERYSGRFQRGFASFERLVVLSECSKEYAESNLKVEIAGIPVEPVSWREVAVLARSVVHEGSHAERRLLRELSTYLGGVVSVQNRSSNWVYVVALAEGNPLSSGIAWRDIVRKRGYYFHPVGGGKVRWPKEPPNYLAFRYDGRLQSIHHVEDYEVIKNAHDKIPEMKDEEWEEPHFLYTLGPAFGPDKEIKTGKVYPSGRVWCMLDTLFVCETISEARDLSKKREE